MGVAKHVLLQLCRRVGHLAIPVQRCCGPVQVVVPSWQPRLDFSGIYVIDAPPVAVSVTILLQKLGLSVINAWSARLEEC